MNICEAATKISLITILYPIHKINIAEILKNFVPIVQRTNQLIHLVRVRNKSYILPSQISIYSSSLYNLPPSTQASQLLVSRSVLLSSWAHSRTSRRF